MNDIERRLYNVEKEIEILKRIRKHLEKKDLWVIFFTVFGSFLSIYIIEIYSPGMIPLVKFIICPIIVLIIVIFFYYFVNKN